MARYKVNANSIVLVTDAAGTVRSMGTYVDTISALGREVDALDVTGFADAAERFIAGIEKSNEVRLGGAFEDTGTTGPDAVFSALVGTISTLVFNPVGTASGNRKITGTFLFTGYKPSAAVKGRVNYEVTARQDGTLAIGTN